MAPLEPTSAPVTMSRSLFSMNPVAAAAQPEELLSIDTTTRISAPPIALTMWIPKASASTVITMSGVEPDRRAYHHRAEDPCEAAGRDVRPENRRQHGDGHADHAVEVAAPRALGIRQPAEAQDEEDRRADVGDRRKRRRHHLRNICSMRCVTAKPPNMLMATSAMLTSASPTIHLAGPSALPAIGGATRTSAPLAMMLLIAVVTLINGGGRPGGTVPITLEPTKHPKKNNGEWSM